jgi:hypothetical protein
MSAQVSDPDSANSISCDGFACKTQPQYASGGGPSNRFSDNAKIPDAMPTKQSLDLESYALLMTQSFEGRVG